MLQNIPLHQLAAVRFTEYQTTRAAAHELTQHRGQARTDPPPARAWNPRPEALRAWLSAQSPKCGSLHGWNECRDRVLPRPASAHSPRATHTTCNTVLRLAAESF